MNKWVRLQDKITSMRAPAGILLIMFSCIGLVYLALAGPNLRLYFTHQTKGVITTFEPLIEDGIAEHYFQTVNLYGWVRYDKPMDLIGDHNHVLLRMIIVQDESSQYAILLNNHKMYSLRDSDMKNIYGVVRKMSAETYALFMDAYGDEITALQSAGWTVEPQYYINELETITDPGKMKGILIFAGVNASLIVLCLIPFLVPHPKTIVKNTLFKNK
ncbi:MAG: hypothetical protein JEZ00_17965 [Anaerolineaceae bacterium]|nr:hypothetical protein [Anaerolineaceae bacterium]